MKSLNHRIEKIPNLAASCVGDLGAVATPEFFTAGQHLVSPGKVQTHLYFIEEGVALCKFKKQKDQDFVKWFASAGSFMVSMKSFHFQRPSKEYITACTDLKVIAIRKTDYDQLLCKYPSLDSYAQRIIEHTIHKAEIRLYDLVMLDAYDRYCQFVEEHARMVNQVKGSDIASYLCITPSTLSNIRKRYRNEAKSTNQQLMY
jgi:CRP/FNR family transcriptional regulator, anaerobic regulatory protein